MSAKIMIEGYAWKSQQNGAVYNPNGLSPCLNCGQHAGVEPKINEIVYEKDYCVGELQAKRTLLR